MTDARKYVKGDDQMGNPDRKSKQGCNKFNLRCEIWIARDSLLGLDEVEGGRGRNRPQIKHSRSRSRNAQFWKDHLNDCECFALDRRVDVQSSITRGVGKIEIEDPNKIEDKRARNG